MAKKRKARSDGAGGATAIVAASSSSFPAGEVGEETASTGCLTDDALALVFSRIPTRILLSCVALVCRRWRRLCTSDSDLELVPSPFSIYSRPWGSVVVKDLMDLATRYSSRIQKVVLKGLKHMKTMDIISLVLKLPKLTSLSIIFSPLLFTVDLEGIANHFPSQLVSLDLHVDHLVTPFCHEWIYTPPPFIHEGFLQQLQQKCPNLRMLDLDGYIPTTSRGLDDLLSVYCSLTSLDLSSHEIGWPEVEKIFKGCKHLQHLSVVSPLFIKSANNGDDDDYDFDACTSSSRRVGRYQSGAPQRISSGLDLESCFPGHLSSIRFYSSPHRSVPLDLDPLSRLIRGRGQQLQHLHGHSLFNTSWHTISVWCANLQSLDLSYSSDKLLDLTGVEEVVLCGLPRLLRRLKRVALPTATDRILVEFGHFCPGLKELQFQGYGHGTINSSPRRSVTDRGVVALAEGCNALKVLNLAGSQNITISSIRALAFHCRSLKVLILNGCHNLRHDGFLALLPRLAQSLLLLDLVGSKIDSGMTMKIFEHLLVHGSSLRVLAVPNIRNKSLHQKALELKLQLPSLNIRSGSSGIEWDGFYHAHSLVEQ